MGAPPNAWPGWPIPPKTERNREMAEVWQRERLTFRELASRYEVTYERARQIVYREVPNLRPRPSRY